MLLGLWRELLLAEGLLSEIFEVKLHFRRDVASSTSGEVLYDFVAIYVVRPFGFLSVWELLDAFLKVELIPPFGKELRELAIGVSKEVDSFATLSFVQVAPFEALMDQGRSTKKRYVIR